MPGAAPAGAGRRGEAAGGGGMEAHVATWGLRALCMHVVARRWTGQAHEAIGGVPCVPRTLLPVAPHTDRTHQHTPVHPIHEPERTAVRTASPPHCRTYLQPPALPYIPPAPRTVVHTASPPHCRTYRQPPALPYIPPAPRTAVRTASPPHCRTYRQPPALLTWLGAAAGGWQTAVWRRSAEWRTAGRMTTRLQQATQATRPSAPTATATATATRAQSLFVDCGTCEAPVLEHACNPIQQTMKQVSKPTQHSPSTLAVGRAVPTSSQPATKWP